MLESILSTYQKWVDGQLLMPETYLGKSGLVYRMMQKNLVDAVSGAINEEGLANTSFGIVGTVAAGKITAKDNFVNVNIGDYLISTSSGKAFAITAVSGKDITATNVATTDFSVGDIFRVISSGVVEGSVAGETNKLTMILKNDRQIYLNGITFSGTRMAQSSFYQEGTLPSEIRTAMSKHIATIEGYFWTGSGATVTKSGQQATTNTGIFKIFDSSSTNNGLPTTWEKTGVSTLTSDAIQEAIEEACVIADLQGMIFDQDTRLIVPNTWVNVLKKDQKIYMQNRSDAIIGRNPYVYEGGGFSINLEMDPYLNGGRQAFLMNDSQFFISQYQDRYLKLVEEGIVSDAKKFHIVSEITPVFKGISTAVRIKLSA